MVEHVTARDRLQYANHEDRNNDGKKIQGSDNKKFNHKRNEKGKRTTVIKGASECQMSLSMMHPFLIARPLGLTTGDPGHSQGHLLEYHLNHRP